MATTSYLYHTLALKCYQLERTEYREGAVYYHVSRKKKERQCAHCRARWFHLVMNGTFRREFHALPVGRRKQFIVLHGHFQQCRCCGRTLKEPIDFAEGKRRRLKSFDRFVIDLCRIAPIKHVACFLGVGWDMIKAIFKGHLALRLQRRKLNKVRYIAVDEFAIRRGHHYMTLVIDLEAGTVLYAHEGRDAVALILFLEELKRKKAKLRAVAMDMWPAYLQAVKHVFPHVDVVHDPYHVVAIVNRAIDETRRDLYRQLAGQERQVLKGSRFLLLRGMENLEPRSLERLMELMEINEPLYQAYLLKEDLRMFWNLPNAEMAQTFLKSWIDQARTLGLKHFVKLADTLEKHLAGLLTYFQHRISTGPLEGLNNKIKVLKRQAYGFRDQTYFKLRLYFIHESVPAFAG
jgi:transposase